MLETCALAVPPMRTLTTLNQVELRRATLTASRIDLNLNRKVIRNDVEAFDVRCISSQCFSIQQSELETIVALDGGRFVLTNDCNGIVCRDIQTGREVASHSFDHWFDVWQTRSLPDAKGFILLVLGWKSHDE
jgi:hypothetical protein